MEVVSHPALARLHPTGQNPERRERVGVLIDHVGTYTEGGRATLDQVDPTRRVM